LFLHDAPRVVPNRALGQIIARSSKEVESSDSGALVRVAPGRYRACERCYAQRSKGGYIWKTGEQKH
jgi:hypothetical protein